MHLPITLLIVDDSDLVRASLRSLLGSVAGIASIREAATLGEALASVWRDPPVLVILDLNLPDGLGMNIIERLKQLSPTLWLALLTIHADPFYRQRCLALGADWFFDKASETDALLEVVRQLVAQNRMSNPDQGNPYEQSENSHTPDAADQRSGGPADGHRFDRSARHQPIERGTQVGV